MRYGLAVLATMLLAAGHADAGVVVTAANKAFDTDRVSTTTIFIDADRMKIVMPDRTMIYRGDLGHLWSIDPETKTYTEMTSETVEKLGGRLANAQARLGAAQSQLQARLAQMPPERRAMIEQMMSERGGLGGPPVAAPSAPERQTRYVKIGERRTVGSWRCDVYEKTVGGDKEQDICIAPIAAAGLSVADFKVFDSFAAFMLPLRASTTVAARADYVSWSDMNKAIGFDGVPIDTLHYANGRPSRQETLTKIERTAIPASAFELPPGLSRRELSLPR